MRKREVANSNNNIYITFNKIKKRAIKVGSKTKFMAGILSSIYFHVWFLFSDLTEICEKIYHERRLINNVL